MATAKININIMDLEEVKHFIEETKAVIAENRRLKAQLKEGEDSEWVRVRRDKLERICPDAPCPPVSNHLCRGTSSFGGEFDQEDICIFCQIAYLTTTEGEGDPENEEEATV